MKFPLIIGLVVLPHLAIAESHSALQKLDASEYEVRQKAQSELADWLKKQPEEAPKALIAYSRKAQSPEVKNRIYLLLKDDQLLKIRVLSEEFGAPKGFVGIRMDRLNPVMQLDGKKVGVVLVESILPGSPAEIYGVNAGDKIWKIDGIPFVGTRGLQNEFQQRVTKKKAGDKIILELYRGGKLIKINLFLTARDIYVKDSKKEQHYEEWLSEQLQR